MDRGADPDLKSLVALARKLENWPSEEIRLACLNIGKRARQEGEPAFPTFGAIVDELRSLGSSRVSKSAAEKNMEEIEQFFWDHVDYQMEVTGKNEQEVLNGITQPGFTGRRAGTRPAKIHFCAECGGMGMTRHIQAGKTFVRTCGECKGYGRAA